VTLGPQVVRRRGGRVQVLCRSDPPRSNPRSAAVTVRPGRCLHDQTDGRGEIHDRHPCSPG
jgi:hypothetical protein